jgi:hypothetical protein
MKKSETGTTAKAGRKSERINIWLPADQIAWLKTKKNQSETVRALITEAINMEKLKASVKKR